MAFQRDVDLLTSGFDNLRRVHPPRTWRDGASADPRHFENVVEQAIQPLHFRENDVTLLSPVAVSQPRGLQVAGRDSNRRQWRAQVVTDRRKQSRLQFLAAARERSGLPFFEKLRALDCDS